ncbi:T-cell immunomodulatory protein-like [Stegodyphus dumicola]|uniref:T-cell immunomodulatory protein-like n=1 Tax=Stegodyphus dumicola TaxID=202533 RepID=UPI0015ADA330|nr:T-cell immunomodulatory protein-like [Stegodyphus dumicola]
MRKRIFVWCCMMFMLHRTLLAFEFQDITSEIFPLNEDFGVISAFGHFNTDEFTDMLAIQQGGNKLQLFQGSEKRPYFQPLVNCSYSNVITSVIPGDFNGDTVIDIMITLSIDRGVNEVKILWGSNGTINCKSDTIFTVTNQPIVVDFNGDMIPDIIGETRDKERYVWFSSEDKKFKNQSLQHLVRQTIRNPHSSGLIDLNNDFLPDLLIMGEYNMEVWCYTGTEFMRNDSLSYPTLNLEPIVFKWQSTFVDLNLDGKLDHIMPVCYDRKCEKSAILVSDNVSHWHILLDNFINPKDKSNWGFKLPIGSTLEMVALPVTLRVGDIDLDGYPDFLTVLQSKRNASDVRAVILRNIPCKNCQNCSYDRCLEIEWEVPGLKDVQNIQILAFFDLYEDGILDILASSNTKEEWKIHAFKNTEVFDSCFVKVLVLSGLCSRCPVEPYGVNQPGPMVRYNMTKQDGQPVVSTSIQMSQSAHFPLQLPYSIFGLGQTPNFIDILTISIPAKFKKNVHKHDWTQIIPNSQIVVIPNPPVDENKWVTKLFVTPSHLVLKTGIALIGTCVFLSLLVVLLHWKERKEDKLEKMQDAYRFHFDAM